MSAGALVECGQPVGDVADHAASRETDHDISPAGRWKRATPTRRNVGRVVFSHLALVRFDREPFCTLLIFSWVTEDEPKYI